MPGVLLIFLDGVGIGVPDPDVNPFFAARLPTLDRLLGGARPSLDDPTVEGPGGRAFPVDARLGVGGTPQSGTGQIALLTGRNAPELFGRHFGPWPPVKLRPLLREENVFRRAIDAGHAVTFANAHPRGYPETVDPRRVAAVAVAAGSAGLLGRDQESLARGDAVASEIVNEAWRAHFGPHVPSITAEEAGANLARLASGSRLTAFAHYHTDIVGHRGTMPDAVRALERVDAFLGGALAIVESDELVIVVSDHGNLEDVRVGHTGNPALGLAFGSRARELEPPAALTEVAAELLRVLDL